MIPHLQRSIATILCTSSLLLAICYGYTQTERHSQSTQWNVSEIKAKDIEGKEVSFKEFLGSEGSMVCLAFLYPDCPMSQRYGSVLSGIQNVYQKHGVRVIGIVCELDSPEELQQFKKDYGIDFPIFTDLDFQLVRQMGVTVTPEVVVLNAQGSVVYQGRIDDRYKERGVKTPGEPEPELQNALEDVIAGRTVKNPKTEPAGCPIDRPEPTTATTGNHDITFYEDVLPFLRANCQSCHSPTNTGPFSLMNYADAVDWIELGVEEIQARRMPPAQIETDMTLLGNKKPTDSQIQMLQDWIAAGKPQGDAANAPEMAPLPDYSEFDKQLGPPDLILQQDGETTLGATGTDVYTNLHFPWNDPKDRRVRAVQFLPENRKIVHHALIGHAPHEIVTEAAAAIGRPTTDQADDRIGGFYDPHKSGFRNPTPRGDGYPRMAFLTGYVPGLQALVCPKGSTILIPAESDLLVQMHYSRTGKTETDKSRIGIWFEKPTSPDADSGIQNLQIIFLSGNFTVIPKGVNDFRVKAQYTLPHDAELVVCVPHAHHLARWIEINLYEPNQTNPKLLIRVPRWDFNWQAAYYADPPVRLVAGTKLEAIVSYDNTVENPFNPFNPPRPAWHAENTSDEMLLPMLSLSSRHVLDPSQASFREFMSKISLSRFSRRLVEQRYKYLRNPDGTIVRSPYFNPVTDE